MNRFVQGLAFSGALLVLASCQSLSKDECIAADWRVIGEQDGSEGREPQNRFGQHVKACERAGIIPNQTLWNEGYQQGLFNFCTPLRGLSHGQAGQTYSNVCPPALEAGFLSGYQLGLEESRKKADIRGHENTISRKEAEIRDIRKQISDKKIEGRDGRRQIRDIEDDIRDANRALGRAEGELSAIQRRIDIFRENPNASRLYN